MLPSVIIIMKKLAALILIWLWATQSLAAEPAIAWQPWSKAPFEQARKEHKFVFLYLEAVWCHWCHVMQQDTLADGQVVRKLAQHYVAVRVDHDADPLLAERYRDWGWPALIFFAPDGSEIVKRAGYIAPDDFLHLLDAIVADPSPEQAGTAIVSAGASGATHLSADRRAKLLAADREHDDNTLGGWNIPHKYLDDNSIEYGLRRALAGDDGKRAQVQRTLDAAHGLLDPVWGGAYQYSTGGVWTQPHYEKLMRVQARYLALYAQACALWQRPADRAAADAIAGYMLGFLRDPSGAFYVSQDADVVPGQKAADYFARDDAGRRKLGMPRIDRHRYASANGQAIAALAYYADVTRDAAALDAAIRAAEWVLAHRARKDGGFRHSAKPDEGPFLADTLEIGRGFLALYRSTGERRWLTRAEDAAHFIEKTFRSADDSLLSAVAGSAPVAPAPSIDENVSALRFFNLVSHYSGDTADRASAERTMRFLSSDAVVQEPFEESGILLADAELANAPPHLTVVGGRHDERASALVATARAAAGAYARVEFWDRSEGPLPHPDVPYPKFEKPAGYVCSAGRCSAPSFEAPRYREQIARLAGADRSEHASQH